MLTNSPMHRLACDLAALVAILIVAFLALFL